MDLKDKIVLITGSSIGIGRETAIKFAEKGAKVIITYFQDKEEGIKTHEECKKYNESYLIPLNLLNDESINSAFNFVKEKFGKLHILINNAGIIYWKRLMDQNFEEIKNQIGVNLEGLIKITRAFLPMFYEQKEGIIINISSGAGKYGFENLTTYCATKFGVRGFTQALAKELPEGIRTYCVNPGMTATRMTNFRGTDPKKVAEIIVKTAEEKLNKNSGDDIDVWDYL